MNCYCDILEPWKERWCLQWLTCSTILSVGSLRRLAAELLLLLLLLAAWSHDHKHIKRLPLASTLQRKKKVNQLIDRQCWQRWKVLN